MRTRAVCLLSLSLSSACHVNVSGSVEQTGVGRPTAQTTPDDDEGKEMPTTGQPLSPDLPLPTPGRSGAAPLTTDGGEEEVDDDGKMMVDQGVEDEETGEPKRGLKVCQYGIGHEKSSPLHFLLLQEKSAKFISSVVDHDDKIETPAVSRWSIIPSYISSLLSSLPDSVSLALKLYPRQGAGSFVDTGACDVTAAMDVAEGEGDIAISSLLASLKQEDIDGGAPLYGALDVAYGHLATKVGIKHVLLSGLDPSCMMSWEDVLQLVVTAHLEEDIRTSVLSPYPSLGSDPHLEELAALGGGLFLSSLPSFTSPSSPLSDLLLCSLYLPEETEHPDLFSLKIGGEEVEQQADCSSPSGWSWREGDVGFSLLLCEESCLSYIAGAEMTYTYFCPV